MESFAYSKAANLQQALDLLKSTEGAQVVAGGSDLLSLLKNEVLTPEALVDIKGLADLNYIKDEGGVLRIGATTTLTALGNDAAVRERFPIIAQTIPLIASPQIRNQATVAGNLCQRPRCWYFRSELYDCFRKGGPTCFAITGRNSEHAIFGGAGCFIVHASDLAPVLIALNAEIALQGPSGKRVLPLEEFFVLPRMNPHAENLLQPGELVVEIRIPAPAADAKGIFVKTRLRGSWDFAATSVAMVAQVQNGTFQDVRVCLGAVAPAPWRSKEAEAALKGQAVTADVAAAAAKAAVRYARPMSENGYKIRQIQAIIKRAALALAK
ncbi:MAG: carbon monoxide dehydrogenase, FAD-binding subunit [Firmicutes bacterium]|nr:carbon monoxide dehydrogenase, FAD-binding subunit [Bacillota bacterium]